MIEAVAKMVTAISNMVTQKEKGQPPQDKDKLWNWYIKDVESWKRFFKIEDGS